MTCDTIISEYNAKTMKYNWQTLVTNVYFIIYYKYDNKKGNDPCLIHILISFVRDYRLPITEGVHLDSDE